MSDSAASRAPRSLLWRTTAVLGLAFLVFFGALVLGLSPFLASAYERSAGDLVRETAARSRDGARIDDSTTDTVVAATLAHARETSAAIVEDAPIELAAGDPAAVRKLLGERLAAAAANDDANLVALSAEMRARHEARLDAEAREAADLAQMRARDFGSDLGARAVAALLGLTAALFLVHGVLLWRSVVAPVARLSEATRQVAEGRLDVRLPVSGDDEVARLAANFNTMTASLERTRGELVALNATLEERVREKSAALVLAERELRHAEKMASLGTLAGGVAHEFNNLLGGIQGCAEDAAHEDDPAEIRETLGVIERTARRGTAITEKLLRFARPEAAGSGVVDLAGIARDVATLVEPEASRTGIRVEVDAPDALRIRADPTGMHQVILNLATNALHAMPNGGTLSIRVARHGDEASLAVADTGTGIAPENRAKLFEPFFTTRPEGTGLGLSVSYGIVRAHQGQIAVESAQGKGSTFTVTLPVGAPEGGPR